MKVSDHTRRPQLPLIRRLIKDEVRADVDAFVAIGDDVPGEYWGRKHFLSERARKWDLSSAAWVGTDPVGYAIVSERTPGQAHLHHLMVTKQLRSAGLGRRLLDRTLAVAAMEGCVSLTLKVANNNNRALRFYFALGFAKQATDGAFLVLQRTTPVTKNLS